MYKTIYKMKSEVWLYPGMAGWHFVSVPKKQSEEIKKKFGMKQRSSNLRQGFGLVRGFGSIPVLVKIGKTSWKTSIFPDKKSSTYLLPLKAEVRKKEGISKGDVVNFSIQIKV